MYLLLCKDEVRATFDLLNLIAPVENLKILGRLPIGCRESKAGITSWLNSRFVGLNRANLEDFCSRTKVTKMELIRETHCISMNDCYWVQEDWENLKWAAVSPYSNKLNRVSERLSITGEGTCLRMEDGVITDLSTPGQFNKCWIKNGEDIYLLKRGNVVPGLSKLEPYCEVLASQVYEKMNCGIPYELFDYNGIVTSKCKCFCDENHSFVAYREVYDKRNSLTLQTDFYWREGWYEDYARMLVCDSLVFNTDRHCGNHGIIYDNSTGAWLRFSPSFDYNLSLFPYLHRDYFSMFQYHYQEYEPKTGGSFVKQGRDHLTSSIRNDLINLKGIQLELPFYTEEFPEERAKWLTDIVNAQIDNILSAGRVSYPSLKVDGLSNEMKYRLKHKLYSDSEWSATLSKLLRKYKVSSVRELEKSLSKEEVV